MDGAARDPDQAELIARLFALVTARCEDAAGIAGHCQGPCPDAELRAGAEQIASMVAETGTLVSAITALLGAGPAPGEPPC